MRVVHPDQERAAVTPRQSIAYARPCARAWEVLAPEFRLVLEHKAAAWSTILSVNK